MYEWNDDRSQLSYKIKEAAHWNDGTKVTAHDVAFTWYARLNYDLVFNERGYGRFIDKIEALDNETVVIYAVMLDGKPANPLLMRSFLGQFHIYQKAWLEDLIERNDGNRLAITLDPVEDMVSSGPYRPYSIDDEVIVLVRDDNYWGQHPSMWGRLPTPRYIKHILPQYVDNFIPNIYRVELVSSDADIIRHYVPNVPDLRRIHNMPIYTFYDETPYNFATDMVTAFFNLNTPILANYPDLRRAIAIAVDYDLILTHTLNNQAPSFSDVPRSLMNPIPHEQALYDREKVAHLQWEGNDIDGANTLLDSLGFEKDTHGWRTYNGERIVLTIYADGDFREFDIAAEIIVAAGTSIGIQIVRFYWDLFALRHLEMDFDITLRIGNDGAGSAQPWNRINYLLGSNPGFNRATHDAYTVFSRDWGFYSNPRVDELLRFILNETDQFKLIDMYTELVEIYLTDIPSFTLMYFPGVDDMYWRHHRRNVDYFSQTVNESIWTGFTRYGDGRNVPPLGAIFGYSIADLYNIRPAGEED
jgi:peptide/nickel transport system substrate-binding protein